jgi:hypothetical protein
MKALTLMLVNVSARVVERCLEATLMKAQNGEYMEIQTKTPLAREQSHHSSCPIPRMDQ